MVITPRVLNRSTLARQLLLAREPIGVEDAVRRVVALRRSGRAPRTWPCGTGSRTSRRSGSTRP